MNELLKLRVGFSRFVIGVLRVFIPLYVLTTVAGFAYSLRNDNFSGAFIGLICGAAATGV